VERAANEVLAELAVRPEKAGWEAEWRICKADDGGGQREDGRIKRENRTARTKRGEAKTRQKQKELQNAVRTA
jgi:hypothetical protein